tara:strand:- start:141 stop:503 length:363 start_codon:yes stop_codon:yes gene_type:complete
MEKSYITWRQYIIYTVVILMVFIANTTFGQITATHFNAEWNNSNGCKWFMDLKDCKTLGTVDVAKNPKEAKKYKIAVVPTIIIFKDGEEVIRFQADLSFKMIATRKEVQEEIDNIIMSDF